MFLLSAMSFADYVITKNARLYYANCPLNIICNTYQNVLNDEQLFYETATPFIANGSNANVRELRAFEIEAFHERLKEFNEANITPLSDAIYKSFSAFLSEVSLEDRDLEIIISLNADIAKNTRSIGDAPELHPRNSDNSTFYSYVNIIIKDQRDREISAIRVEPRYLKNFHESFLEVSNYGMYDMKTGRDYIWQIDHFSKIMNGLKFSTCKKMSLSMENEVCQQAAGVNLAVRGFNVINLL